MTDDTTLPYTFSRRQTTDKLGRRITYYLSGAQESGSGVQKSTLEVQRTAKYSVMDLAALQAAVAAEEAGAEEEEKSKLLPLVVLVQGAGGGSIFQRTKTPGEVAIDKFPLSQTVMDRFEGKARVLMVEKPGVQFLEEGHDPSSGIGIGCSETYLRQHALPRWAEAINACIFNVRTSSLVDKSKTLVLGTSEGGIVAAKIAALDKTVTHVASLYGGGESEIFELKELARRGTLPDQDPNATPEERVQEIEDEWKKIQEDPRSITKFWRGQTYLRWHSFGSESLVDNLLASQAKIFIAHGTNDSVSPIESFDEMQKKLAAAGRSVVHERVEGAEHGFKFTEEDGSTWSILDAFYERILLWFLNN